MVGALAHDPSGPEGRNEGVDQERQGQRDTDHDGDGRPGQGWWGAKDTGA
jgi:hypothetical protein